MGLRSFIFISIALQAFQPVLTFGGDCSWQFSWALKQILKGRPKDDILYYPGSRSARILRIVGFAAKPGERNAARGATARIADRHAELGTFPSDVVHKIVMDETDGRFSNTIQTIAYHAVVDHPVVKRLLEGDVAPSGPTKDFHPIKDTVIGNGEYIISKVGDHEIALPETLDIADRYLIREAGRPPRLTLMENADGIPSSFSHGLNLHMREPDRTMFYMHFFGSHFEAEDRLGVKLAPCALAVEPGTLKYWTETWGFHSQEVELKAMNPDGTFKHDEHGEPVLNKAWFLTIDDATLRARLDRIADQDLNRAARAIDHELDSFSNALGQAFTDRADQIPFNFAAADSNPLNPPIVSQTLPGPSGPIEVKLVPEVHPFHLNFRVPKKLVPKQLRMGAFATTPEGRPVTGTAKVDTIYFMEPATIRQFGRKIEVHKVQIRTEADFEGRGLPFHKYATVQNAYEFTGTVRVYRRAERISGRVFERYSVDFTNEVWPSSYELKRNGDELTEVVTMKVNRFLISPPTNETHFGFNFTALSEDQVLLDGKPVPGLSSPGINQDFLNLAGVPSVGLQAEIFDGQNRPYRGNDLNLAGPTILSTLQRVFGARPSWPILFHLLNLDVKEVRGDGFGPR